MNQSASPVRISLTCTIADAGLLWARAASIAADAFAMSLDDIVETIGPREDPEPDACAAILFDGLVRTMMEGDPNCNIVASTKTTPRARS
ncbi:hypothetical protein H5J25_10460 [Sphingomonas aliaeris]|uniref:Uncharacterized protein n=1 Tax=Sphingomonas aliaeris TaxID=2759526 RepID=A0A974S2Y0_9SPHN|nr:hypothetical protein [Sphingomonas aliaeris]QQV75999.1 hypothetical protein H5J25_10460 [Sphingomonas aliaeris]